MTKPSGSGPPNGGARLVTDSSSPRSGDPVSLLQARSFARTPPCSMLSPMSEQSAKPYLVRAICEWCADNGLTPYIAVKVNSQTRVPAAFVKNGEIVLNIGRGQRAG